ncbi:hypothetical protein ACH5RR_019920 [Cinchona calisaya]|uniref:Uncharacterized protein n=1 Tax=Cinchona calisaya TaxID=153742 RepID=A0ABD2ZSF8_9GENT
MTADRSWTWRKILKIRISAQPYIKRIVGNGTDTNLWYDNRHLIGPLYLHYSQNVLKNLGCTAIDNVAKCIYGNDWSGLRVGERNAPARVLTQATPSDFKPLVCQEDQIKWGSNASGVFSVELATKNIYWAREKVKRAGLKDELNWLSSHWTSESFEDKLKRLAFAIMAYENWNAKIDVFKGKSVSAVGIIRAVVYSVKSSVMGWRNNKKTRESWELALEWSLPDTCSTD